MSIDKRAARLSTLAAVGVVLIGLLGVRLWFLQTVEAEELQADVDASQTREVWIPPQRGRIFDADGRIIADNKRILTLAVDWQRLRDSDDRAEIFRRLSGWVDVPVEEMEESFDSNVHDPLLPFPIKRDIDESTATAILERIEDFPGVSVEHEWQRAYPYAPLASHVLGYMGAISKDDLKLPQFKDYLPYERIGQFGVERSFESLLHGKWGYKKYKVDAAGRPIELVTERDPVPGFDIQLTIDLDLQQFVEQSVQTTLRARGEMKAKNIIVKDPITGEQRPIDPDTGAFKSYKAPAGSSVVMNYLTGEVAAMASYPDFDNRWFEAGISGDKFREIFPVEDENGDPIDPDESILVNRAIQGRYNVGSSFKPFTAFAALSSGLMGPGDTYTDEGTYRLETVEDDVCASGVKCEYRNAWCTHLSGPCVYGTVDTETALAVSSDTFFYRIGELLMSHEFKGMSILQNAVREFGFGSETGIELPFEFDGTVPNAALKKKYAEAGVISPGEGEGYYVGDNVQLAIGQGLLSATPLQLAQGYAALANGGHVYRPTILKAIYEPGTPNLHPGWADMERATVYEHPDFPTDPEITNRVPMTKSQREEIVGGLRRVVSGPGAHGRSTTGEEVFFDVPNDSIHIAGKTGTAQGFGNYPWNDSSIFVGFATDATSRTDRSTGINRKNPWVVTTYLEKAGYGSTGSAPATKCIFAALAGDINLDPVELSSPLNLSSSAAAPTRQQPGTDICWKRSNNTVEGGAVYYPPPEQTSSVIE